MGIVFLSSERLIAQSLNSRPWGNYSTSYHYFFGSYSLIPPSPNTRYSCLFRLSTLVGIQTTCSVYTQRAHCTDNHNHCYTRVRVCTQLLLPISLTISICRIQLSRCVPQNFNINFQAAVNTNEKTFVQISTTRYTNFPKQDETDWLAVGSCMFTAAALRLYTTSISTRRRDGDV